MTTSSKIWDCKRADILRPCAVLYMTAIGIGSLLVSATYRSTITSLAVFYCLLGVGCILEGLADFHAARRAEKAEKRWAHSPEGIVFMPKWHCTLGKYVSCLVLALSTLISVTMVALSYFTGSESTKELINVLIISLLFGTVTALMWAALPYNPPGKPAIELTPEGIDFWRFGRRPHYASWDASPRVEGCINVGGVPRALIETSGGLIYFSMSSLPLGYEQLHRVIAFYVSHPELREELTQQHGLERVRKLMHKTIDDMEVELKGEV